MTVRHIGLPSLPPPASVTLTVFHGQAELRGARATRLIVERGLLQEDPFSLLDVGCSGGIDRIWRTFGDSLRVHAFDPDAAECARLQSAERNPHIHYHASLVGLPPEHEWMRRKYAGPERTAYWENVFARSSMRAHVHGAPPLPDPPPPAPPPVSQPSTEPPTPPPAPQPDKIGLAEFAAQHELTNLDFIKIDTDGADLEVLLSAESCIDTLGVLGCLIECQFQGSDEDTSNTFHNIDRIMKRHGLMVFYLTAYPFSRAALPAPYMYTHFAQTTFGQPVFGDVAFLRDPLWGLDGAPRDLPLGKLLKLICLYEFFEVPDCAAELIQRDRALIGQAIDPDQLLDLLTPPLGGRKVSYQEYTQAIAKNPSALLDKTLDSMGAELQRSGARELPGTVGPVRPRHDQTRIEPGSPVRIVTPSAAWAYAAELPLVVPMHLPGNIWIRIRACVAQGECGFGILNRNQTAFQHRRILSAGNQIQTLFLHVADRTGATSLILENATPGDRPAEILLSEVSMMIVDLPAGVPVPRPGVFTRLWRALHDRY